MQPIPDSPIVLTIAGFDPSGCAGLLADIKTFEQNGVHAMAVCTANTEQNVTVFNKANWIKQEEIISQLNLLQREVDFEFVKIGLVENFELLQRIMDELVKKNPSVKIVWDPVCKASAQFVFHTEIERKVLEDICLKLYLVTPNLDELAVLTPGSNVNDAGSYLSEFCNVLVKGGHSETSQATDILFTKSGIHYFEGEKLYGFSKRGTGCVLSSAIIASLAKGKDLVQACATAKEYVRNYLISNHSLVGRHQYGN